MKKRIVIFASGGGTNAQNVIEHFQQSDVAKVVSVFCNNKNAHVLQRAKALKTQVVLFNKEGLRAEGGVLKSLQLASPDLIVLAGFLLKLPKTILNHFPDKVINIHPALLPKYGGKGMYGRHVHERVVANHETETGITVHYVNEAYDEGTVILQKKVAVATNDTSKTIAKKVHRLEYEWLPKVIENLLT
ncbi:MAG: phosphoribosylglycinamide formyltransferase [Marinirhabdus sp.]